MWESSWARERCAKTKPNNWGIVLMQKAPVKYTVTIKQRQNEEAFQVQIEAKAPLPSAATHITHKEAVCWRKLYHWNRRKRFAQVAFVFSSLQRWNSIIHHNLASGQWSNSVNSLVGLLMHTLRGSCLKSHLVFAGGWSPLSFASQTEDVWEAQPTKHGHWMLV